MHGEVGTEDDQEKFGKLGFEECNAPAEYDLYENDETIGNRREPTVTERWQDDLGEYARQIWESATRSMCRKQQLSISTYCENSLSTRALDKR